MKMSVLVKYQEKKSHQHITAHSDLKCNYISYIAAEIFRIIGFSSDSSSLQHVAGRVGRSRQSGRTDVLPGLSTRTNSIEKKNATRFLFYQTLKDSFSALSKPIFCEYVLNSQHFSSSRSSTNTCSRIVCLQYDEKPAYHVPSTV